MVIFFFSGCVSGWSMLILVKFSEGFGFSAEECTPKYQAFLRGGGSVGSMQHEQATHAQAMLFYGGGV